MNLLQRASMVTRRDLVLGTLAERLASMHGRRTVAAGPDTPALSYVDAAERVARWSGGVAARAVPGEAVVVAATSSYDFLLMCLAVARAGCLVVPVNHRMRPDEIDHVVADCGASLVVRDATELDGHRPLVRAVDSRPDDVAALFYTSGTTGKPKGARLTHRALAGQPASAALWPAGLRHDEAVVALPVAHIMGFAALLGLAVAGVPVWYLSSFGAKEVLDAIEQRRATAFIGVPAMYRMLVEAGAEERDLSSVRVFASGADVMPPDLSRRFKRMGASAKVLGRPVGEAAFIEGYGMVELGGGAAVRVSPPGVNLPWANGLGLPLPGYRFRVMDDGGREVGTGQVGELWVKGPGVLDGYHGDDGVTATAVVDGGWLRTGDLARKGFLGLVSFAGRQKDVVKVGGYSVYAVEVEQVLEEHPDVVEAAVVGIIDERMGEVPAAAVRLRAAATVTGADIAAWAQDRLAPYKVPRRVLVVDDLPRTGTTKVQKAELLPLFTD